jgi:hypothetical protein
MLPDSSKVFCGPKLSLDPSYHGRKKFVLPEREYNPLVHSASEGVDQENWGRWSQEDRPSKFGAGCVRDTGWGRRECPWLIPRAPPP